MYGVLNRAWSYLTSAGGDGPCYCSSSHWDSSYRVLYTMELGISCYSPFPLVSSFPVDLSDPPPTDTPPSRRRGDLVDRSWGPWERRQSRWCGLSHRVRSHKPKTNLFPPPCSQGGGLGSHYSWRAILLQMASRSGKCSLLPPLSNSSEICSKIRIWTHRVSRAGIFSFSPQCHGDYSSSSVSQSARALVNAPMPWV